MDKLDVAIIDCEASSRLTAPAYLAWQRIKEAAKAPPAAVPEGIDAQFAKIRAADELANAKLAVSRCITALLDIKVMIEEGDYDEAVSHIDALTDGAAARKGES